MSRRFSPRRLILRLKSLFRRKAPPTSAPPPPAPPLELPTPVLSKVLEHLRGTGSLGTVAALCQVNKTGYSIAMPILYRRVDLLVIGESQFFKDESLSRNESILSSPRPKAGYVRCLTLSVLRRPAAHIFSLLWGFLAACQSLEILYFRDTILWNPPPDVTFPRLRSLFLTLDLHKWYNDADPSLAECDNLTSDGFQKEWWQRKDLQMGRLMPALKTVHLELHYNLHGDHCEDGDVAESLRWGQLEKLRLDCGLREIDRAMKVPNWFFQGVQDLELYVRSYEFDDLAVWPFTTFSLPPIRKLQHLLLNITEGVWLYRVPDLIHTIPWKSWFTSLPEATKITILLAPPYTGRGPNGCTAVRGESARDCFCEGCGKSKTEKNVAGSKRADRVVVWMRKDSSLVHNGNNVGVSEGLGMWRDCCAIPGEMVGSIWKGSADDDVVRKVVYLDDES